MFAGAFESVAIHIYPLNIEIYPHLIIIIYLILKNAIDKTKIWNIIVADATNFKKEDKMLHPLMRMINRISRCGILYRSEKLKPYGINGYQNLYIQNICKYPGVSQEQLSRIILVNKSNVARQVAALEKDGFLIRKVCETDKRQFQIYPTQKALELNPIIHNVLDEWNNYLLEDFSPQEQELLNKMLSKILDKAIALVSEPEETA